MIIILSLHKGSLTVDSLLHVTRHQKQLAYHVKEILGLLGEDASREGLISTSSSCSHFPFAVVLCILDASSLPRFLFRFLAVIENPPRSHALATAGLVKTPSRVAKALGFLTSGSSTQLATVVNGGDFWRTP